MSEESPTHHVTFQPSGRRGEFPAGGTLLDAARALGVSIRSDCGGKGTCGKCRVVVVEGGQALAQPTEFEAQILHAHLSDSYRLACRTALCASLQLMVPEESRVERAIILTTAQARPLELDPLMQNYHLQIAPPSLADPLGDAERLLAALEQTYGLRGVHVAYPVLRELPATLRRAGWDVTATIWDWEEPLLVGVQPGYVEKSYGIAVDIGTTTVVGYLAELSSGRVAAVEALTNPQVAFGEDVLARISYAMEHADGRRQLHAALIDGLNEIIAGACRQAGVELGQVVEMVAVGNTAMHHFLLDLEAEFVAKSPFPPAAHSHADVRACDLGLLALHPAANVHVLPIEAGFVGADNVAALIATEPYEEDAVTLLIDIGTNGELVLGNRALGLVACSVAAGPALEGACIQFGMRASGGAIEHVQIDPRSFEVTCRVIDGGPSRGICGSGIIEAVAQMLQAGLLSSDGRLNIDSPSPRMRSGANGREFVLVWARETAIGQDIVITQDDVRNVQLAKGAFYAGGRILMERLGVARIEKVLLAGAFGNYVDPGAAMAIGLFPACPPEQVLAVGNAAGHGALMALLSRRKRAEAVRVARQVRYVELTVERDFQARFVAGTIFPELDV